MNTERPTSWIIRTFGLQGSWWWACRMMIRGHIVYPRSAIGGVMYRMDREYQGRIQWSFSRKHVQANVLDAHSDGSWENANVFVSDCWSTDWTIFYT